MTQDDKLAIESFLFGMLVAILATLLVVISVIRYL